MYFQCGSYRHEPNEVDVASFTRSVEWSARGEPFLTKISMGITGTILGTDPSDLTAKLTRLEAAYALQGQNAGLYEDNGRPTVHVLSSGTAIGGVRSSGVSYPEGGGIEYAVQRKYSVTLEADYPFDNGVNLLEFNETLSFTGTCKPRWIFLFPINGEPEKQTVQLKTSQKVTQSGSAMGYLSRPAVPPPLWPADEHEEARQISPTSPRIVRGRLVDFGIQWSYSFESATPLVGQPRTQ